MDWPDWKRYENAALDAVHTRPRLINPFNKNKLKGDIPVWGKRGFFTLTGSSDTLLESRRASDDKRRQHGQSRQLRVFRRRRAGFRAAKLPAGF